MMLTVGSCEIPDKVVDVWRNTEWRLTKRGKIRAKSGKCPICEACKVLCKKSYFNSRVWGAAKELDIISVSSVIRAADDKNSAFREDLEKALGLRRIPASKEVVY